MKDIVKKFFLSLFLYSFLLNFVWEVTQAPLYVATGLGTRDLIPFIVVRWWVSVGDVFIIFGIYFAVAAIFRDRRWPLKKTLAPWMVFLVDLVVCQVIVEYFSVYVLHRWAYSAFMPTIEGIGLSPLLQMLFLAPIAVILSRKHLEE